MYLLCICLYLANKLLSLLLLLISQTNLGRNTLALHNYKTCITDLKPPTTPRTNGCRNDDMIQLGPLHS